MSYCTIDDIKAHYLNKSFGASDWLTQTEVEGFISQDTAIIDASLRAKYSLPISNADDLLLLKYINTLMTVGTIDDIFREKSEDGRFDRQRYTRKEALDMLKQIKEGTMLLNSAKKTSVIKFNITDSEGNEVQKRFKDSNADIY